MRVLQFAFGDDARNPYLPHNFTRDTVVYSGTHDNDTSLGWFAAGAGGRARTRRRSTSKPTATRSIGISSTQLRSRWRRWRSILLQDVLGLGSEARMNRPGDAEGCWGWRFQWSQVQPWHARAAAADFGGARQERLDVAPSPRARLPGAEPPPAGR